MEKELQRISKKEARNRDDIAWCRRFMLGLYMTSFWKSLKHLKYLFKLSMFLLYSLYNTATVRNIIYCVMGYKLQYHNYYNTGKGLQSKKGRNKETFCDHAHNKGKEQ